MSEAEIIEASYFQMHHILLYCFVIFVIMIAWLQHKWANICDTNIQVLVAQQGGGGAFRLAPKEGGSVTITNPITDEKRTWPVNELSTIDITYPGVGFVPKFMQKSIRLAILNEGDLEPMLNRSPHRKNVASPDVITFIEEFKEKTTDEELKKEIDNKIKGLSTGPTREMIADPAVLGGLMASNVMKELASISNDFMELMGSVNAKLTNIMGPKPIIVYIGLGLIVILTGYTIYQIAPLVEAINNFGGASEITTKLDAIMSFIQGFPTS